VAADKPWRKPGGWSCDVGEPCDLRSFYTPVCFEVGNGGFGASGGGDVD
jgi:hypothetical protein